MDKLKVARNFSKASTSYDKYSIVQKIVADKTYSLIEKYFFNSFNNSSKIIELGAGTGYLTKKIIQHINFETFIVNDISENMLNVLKENVKFSDKADKVAYRAFDCDNIKQYVDNRFDLIISASTFQWSSDVEKLMKNIFDILEFDGYLIFSMFGKDSFKELNYVCKKVKPEYKIVSNIISFEELRDNLKNIGFSILESYNSIEKRYFNSIKEFKISQKNSGAISVQNNNVMLSKEDWLKINDLYNELYSTSQGLEFSYNIYYFVLKKMD